MASVHKGHRVQFFPNNKQQARFWQWFGVHRWAYNWGLARKIAAYKETGKSPGAYTLMKELVVLKHSTHPWLSESPSTVPREALRHLDVAYRNFFRRVKEGAKQKGFPKFKSRETAKHVCHMAADAGVCRTEGNRVRLSTMGWVRMRQALRFDGKHVATVAIMEQAGRWYISFNVEVEVEATRENQGRVVGIDLGIKTLATTSDGHKYENPRYGRHLEKLLARAQRQLAHKKRGSKRYRIAKRRVARIHKCIVDSRKNAIHHATAQIATDYDVVYLEDLNVSGMMRNHSLAKALADASMREFRRQTEYKVGWNGGEVVLIDRWFPSSKTCHVCGLVNDALTLGDRAWDCECGAHHDRDLNAAINIKHRGELRCCALTVRPVGPG